MDTPRNKPMSASSLRAEAAFRARLAELSATLLEPSWLGNHIPHRVSCAAGHDCTPRPASVQQGQGICRTCAGKDPRAAEAAFRARLAELGATLLEPSWLGGHQAHRVRCAAGHDCTPRPKDVQRGKGVCLTCVGQDPRVAEAAFRARLAELGATLLEPSWLGIKHRYLVRCAEGHEYRPRPVDVQRGRVGCLPCAGLDSQVAEAAFRARLAELGATLLEPSWLGNKRPHLVRCAEGHRCRTRPNNVQQGHGVCRKCKGMTWDVFYVVVDDTEGVVKFGITSGDSGRRIAVHRRAGFGRTVRVFSGLTADTAPELERTVLAALRDAREKPVKGQEYFPARVLPLVLDLVDNHPALRAT